MLFSYSSFKRKEELLPLFLLNITCPSITLSFISGVTLLKRIPISESCGFIPPFPLLSLPAHYSMEGFLLFLSSISYATTCKKHPSVSVTTIVLLVLPLVYLCASFISKQFSPIKVVIFLYPHNFSKKI